MALLDKTFVLSDESVNRYKFRVLTAGIGLEAFKKNPVMLLMHNRTVLPIGKWENIRKENGKLLAEPNFDDNDPLAQSVQKKVEDGILNAASIGFDEPLKISDDPKLMRPGQELGTVIECELLEVSIVDIPGNRGATVSLVSEAAISLGSEMDDANVRHLFAKASTNQSGMKQIFKALGLAETADEVEAVLAIRELKAQAEQHSELTAQLAVAKGLKTPEEVDGFKRDLAANATQHAGAVLLAKASKPELVATTGGKPNLAEVLAGKQGQNLEAGDTKIPKDRLSWGFNEWGTKDPQGLLKLKHESPEDYKSLYKAQYGNVVVGK